MSRHAESLDTFGCKGNREGVDLLQLSRSSPRKRGPRLGDVRMHSALKTRVNALAAPGSPLPRGRTELVARVSKISLREQAVQHGRCRQLAPEHAIVLLGHAE